MGVMMAFWRFHNMTQPSTSIEADSRVVTLITTYHTRPSTQREVLQTLKQFVHRHLGFQMGFVSSTVHVSEDGTRILNYVQWSTLADFQRMITRPEVQSLLQQLTRLARNEMAIYRVDHVEHCTESVDTSYSKHMLPQGEMGISREI
jgi:quinol monooxygenase YgiN